jgi:uncharacterized protein
MIRIVLASGLLATSLFAQAQSASAPPSSPAKKELVAKIIKLQQPGIDGVARQVVEVPAMQMLQAAGAALQQRVSADRRQAVATDIQADARKYVEEMSTVARDRVNRIAPGIIAPYLEERFTEDELKQLVAIIESPVNRKYQAMGAEMQKALTEKLVAEIRPSLEPKLKALNQSIGNRLAPAASTPSTGK